MKRTTKPVHVQSDKHSKLKVLAAKQGVSLEKIVDEILERGMAK